MVFLVDASLYKVLSHQPSIIHHEGQVFHPTQSRHCCTPFSLPPSALRLVLLITTQLTVVLLKM